MRLLQLTGIALWLLASSAASWAQGGPDLAACFASEPELAALATRCKAHGGCTLVLDRRTECTAARGFLQRLKEQMGDYPEIENNSVMSAATPPLRAIKDLASAATALHQKVQRFWRSPNRQTGMAMRSSSGTEAFYEGEARDGVPSFFGTLISSNGLLLRGIFVDGKLKGEGQAVLPSGTVYIGTMEGNRLNGQGAVQQADGVVLTGEFRDLQPFGMLTTHFADGRSQKAFYDAPGKLVATGEIAKPGDTAADPDLREYMRRAELSIQCIEQRIALGFPDPRTKAARLRDMVRGPCGSDAATLNALAEAEKEAGLAASRELEQAREQAAARAQADAERNAMVSNFLGQVSSILGSYQNMRQSASAGAAVAAAAAAARPTSPPATVAAASSSGSTAAAASPPQSTGRTRPVHNPAADASSCVRMVQTSASTTARISGNFTFHNGCNSTVEVFWCFPRPGGACTGGGTWTIGAGKGWPVMDNEAQIRWAACRGANGGGWDRDVPAGTRYTCALLQW